MHERLQVLSHVKGAAYYFEVAELPFLASCNFANSFCLAVDKREAARRAAETRRQNAVDKRNEMYRRALEQQNMREEQREQMREAEGESDEDYEIEPGYTALMTKTVSFRSASEDH